MKCTGCEVPKIEEVPFAVLEETEARSERREKRLLIAVVIAIILLFASNLCWLYAWMQYDYSGEVQTVEMDSHEGPANFIGNDGDITNGQN